MYIPPLYSVTLVSVAMVVIVSWFMRCRKRGCSSWPTWLLVLTTLLLLVQNFKLSDPLWLFELGVFVIVLSRWLVALIRRERSYGWAFYLVILIVAENLIYPAAYWYTYER